MGTRNCLIKSELKCRSVVLSAGKPTKPNQSDQRMFHLKWSEQWVLSGWQTAFIHWTHKWASLTCETRAEIFSSGLWLCGQLFIIFSTNRNLVYKNCNSHFILFTFIFQVILFRYDMTYMNNMFAAIKWLIYTYIVYIHVKKHIVLCLIYEN